VFISKSKVNETDRDMIEFNRTFSNENSFQNDRNHNYYQKYSEKISKKELLRFQTINSIACFECGSNINFNDKFCPNCGDSTDKEFANY
jgi:rubrerythrin